MAGYLTRRPHAWRFCSFICALTASTRSPARQSQGRVIPDAFFAIRDPLFVLHSGFRAASWFSAAFFTCGGGARLRPSSVLERRHPACPAWPACPEPRRERRHLRFRLVLREAQGCCGKGSAGSARRLPIEESIAGKAQTSIVVSSRICTRDADLAEIATFASGKDVPTSVHFLSPGSVWNSTGLDNPICT
jgi:hypothetical protein